MVSGVCAAIALAYFTMVDRGETVPDRSLETIARLGGLSKADRPPKESLGPVLTERVEFRTAPEQQGPAVGEKIRQPSPENTAPPPSSALKTAVTIPHEDPQIAFSSDPYGVLPSWLSERGVDVPWKPRAVSAKETDSVPRNPISAIAQLPDSVLERPSEPSQPIVRQANAPEPLPQNSSKPVFPTENKAAVQFGENLGRGREPKLAGALASFVAIQGNDLLKDAPPLERREPRGYITVESKPESVRNAAVRTRPAKTADRRPKTGDEAATTPDNPPKSSDESSDRGDAPPAPGTESGDLRRFALDFVRAGQSGSLADQHRFYAESVHFYGEGDLSWAGVAAATRRRQLENQNRQYGTAGPAVVKGPVDGGFYVVDQPVSWSRTDVAHLTRGRSIVRLRVVSTGRGGWKITSIEEIGQ